jgi:hypothetical protein
MGVKISNLPAIVTPALTDIFPTVQAGVTYKATLTQLTSLFLPLSVANGGTGLTSTTINQILYSSAANTITGLATAASGVLVTSAGGVPSISSTVPAALTIPRPLIQGVTDGSAAGAGVVGEVISSVVLNAAGISLSTGVVSNVTTITLTPGDWLIFGQVGFIFAAGTTATQLIAGLSQTSATSPGDAKIAEPFTVIDCAFTASSSQGFAISPGTVSVSVNTPYYLIADATFAVSTMKASGFIYARRVR